MHRKFDVLFLKEAIDFLDGLDPRVRNRYIITWIKQALLVTPNHLKS